MVIKTLKRCPQFVAGDKSQLREILNPRKEKLQINYSLAWATVKPGEKTLPHRLKFSEVYYILNGAGIFHINDEENLVKESDAIYIPPDAIQSIENMSKEVLEFLCIVDPAWQPDAEEIINDKR